jgi:hypothetical protein
MIQILKVNDCQPRLLYPAKLLFKIDVQMKTFQDKCKLKQFMTTNPGLQKILKEILHRDEEEK